MNSYPRKSYAALALITGIAVAAANLAFAQANATPAPTSDDSVLKLEKFEVTGSYLPPAANSTANPVITVDNNAIQNAGSPTNLLEVLRKTVPQFTGNGNLGAANANIGSGSTQGGSQLALRNTQTLVLINGRRATNSPVSATGGFNFVDVSLIPIAAVDRIEVLADGASAIYGTDAVAGVVNIILKNDFQGFEVGAHYGVSPNTGKYEEKSGYVIGGVSNGKTNITISADWTTYTPIYQWQRPYSAVAFGTPTFAGSVTIGTKYYYLDPSLTDAPITPGGLSPAALVAAGTYSGPRTASGQTSLFNLSQYVTQTIGSERNSFTMSFDHQITDYLKAFGDFMYANTQTHSQINGQPINSSQSMLDLGTGVNAAGTGPGSLIPVGQFGNPFNVPVQARNRLVNHPREYRDENTSIRGTFGLFGKIGETGWNWEAGAVWNRGREDYTNPGVINQAHLDAATFFGDFNWFSRAPLSDANNVADQVVGTASGDFISLLQNYDLKVTGKAFDLPGGPVDVAIGGEIRHEGLTAGADPLSQIDPVTGALGWNGATTLYPFQSSRKVTSIFGEVRVPVVKDMPGAHLLEVSAAIRHEDYSDTTNPTVPKFSVRYLPVNDEFALRASYSKSFSAPTLFSLFGPSSIGFTPAFDLTASNPALFPPDGIYGNYQANQKTGSNPDLKPSTAKNFSFGFVWSPKKLGSVDMKGFSISMDYWNIKQKDLISSIGAPNILQDVELNGANSIYIDKVSFGSFGSPNHPTAPGQISTGVPDDIYVTDTQVNIAAQQLSGVDMTIKYTYNADSVGRFDFISNIGYYESYKVTFLPGQDPEQDAGNSSFSNGTIPRWLSYSSVEYSRGKYNAYVGWRHIPGVHDIADDTHTGSFDTFDVSASFTFGSEVKFLSGAQVRLGCNNVFNKFGPADPTIFTDSNVDTSTYGAIGRMYYVDVKYKF